MKRERLMDWKEKSGVNVVKAGPDTGCLSKVFWKITGKMLVCEKLHIFSPFRVLWTWEKGTKQIQDPSSCILGTGIPHCFPKVHDWNPASLYTGCSREKCLFWALFKEINNLPHDSPQSPVVQHLSPHIRSQRYSQCEQEMRVRSAMIGSGKTYPSVLGPRLRFEFLTTELYWRISIK